MLQLQILIDKTRAYSIGKERILLNVSHATGLKVRNSS